MRNVYKFCSICGGKLKSSKGNLACTRCSFVNYRNPRPTVTAIVLYKGKMLLTKRRRDPFKGWWDVTGGFIDKGETPEHALARELKEELGMQIASKKLFGVYTGTYPSDTDPFYVLTVVYIVRPKSGTLAVRDTEELIDARWFLRKELPKKIAFDSNRRVVKDFLRVWK